MFSWSCAITDYDTDTVILTGGYDDMDNSITTVERYGHDGLEETLPSLNKARDSHGCGCYYNKAGQKVEFEVLLQLTLSSTGATRDWRVQL